MMVFPVTLPLVMVSTQLMMRTFRDGLPPAAGEGIGIDRLAMLKYGIPDLRTFFESDTRWLSHYGFDPLNRPNRVTK